MTKHLAVLGASDPEMTVVESLLRECGIDVAHATIGGRRVTAAEAYRADAIRVQEAHDGAGDVTVYLVECGPRLLGIQHDDEYTGPVVRIDHHRIGDPGFGASPEDFLRASSLGQVIAELARLDVLQLSSKFRSARYCGENALELAAGEYGHVTRYTQTPNPNTPYQLWWVGAGAAGGRYLGWEIPLDLVLTAAADHCLGHAYAGRCPGVDPDELLRWRVELRALFQGRSTDSVVADVVAANAALGAAPGASRLLRRPRTRICRGVSSGPMNNRHRPVRIPRSLRAKYAEIFTGTSGQY